MSYSLLPETGCSKSNAIIIDDDEDVQMDTPTQAEEAEAEASNASLNATGHYKPEKWMTTPATIIVGTPLITLGEGKYQATFNGLVVQKNRADFFKSSYPQLRAGNVAANQYYEEQAKRFPLIRENTTVETADGTRLLAFIKGGMATGVSSEEYATLRKQSEDAAAEVIRVDPNNSTGDSRLVAREEKRERLALQGLKLIRKVSNPNHTPNLEIVWANQSFLALLLHQANWRLLWTQHDPHRRSDETRSHGSLHEGYCLGACADIQTNLYGRH